MRKSLLNSLVGLLVLVLGMVLPMSVQAEEPPKEEKKAEARADPMSPVGVWKTIDDGTKKKRSLVKLWIHDGKLYGRITKLYLREGEPENPVCENCKGSLKDKPINGMRIINGLKKDGDEWSGGQILDPESGKYYKVFIEVQDGGKKMKVRGYMGVAMFGRTQYWYRVK